GRQRAVPVNTGRRPSPRQDSRSPVYARTATRLRGLDHLVRSQAARTHANTLGAAVDHCSDRLQVRLEAPRAHVVGVAVLTSDDGGLAANLTMFGHHSNP